MVTFHYLLRTGAGPGLFTLLGPPHGQPAGSDRVSGASNADSDGGAGL